MKKSLEQIRKENNDRITKALKSKEYIEPRVLLEDVFYPIRKPLKKDKKAVDKLYNKGD